MVIEETQAIATLTFCLRFKLPFAVDEADDADARGCDPRAGDIDLAGTVGGGPGSAAGERR